DRPRGGGAGAAGVNLQTDLEADDETGAVVVSRRGQPRGGPGGAAPRGATAGGPLAAPGGRLAQRDDRGGARQPHRAVRPRRPGRGVVMEFVGGVVAVVLLILVLVFVWPGGDNSWPWIP